MKWKMIHPVSGKELSGFEASELVAFLATIPADQQAGWFVWAPGLKDWIPAGDCAELRQSEPPRPRAEAVAVAAPESSGADKRRHPRADLRLKVVVVRGSRAFRTYTRNVSMGGILLESKLPWEVDSAEPCQVFLSSDDETSRIEFVAKIVVNPRQKDRIAFAFEPGAAVSEEKLRAWIGRAFANCPPTLQQAG